LAGEFLFQQLFNFCWVDVASFWVYIHEYRRGAALGYSFSSGNEGKRSGYDLIARLDAAGEESKLQSIGARSHTNGELCPTVSGNLRFKSLYLRAKDELAAFYNFLDCIINLFSY